jgi:TnpA family transposase
VVKPDVPALTRARLVQVDQGYFRAENISAGNGLFIEAQAKIDAARVWGGGLVASADGVRFTVPVKSLYSGYSPKYFGLRHKGATWLNVINDQVMGLDGVVVPGTLRDSLFILDAIHARASPISPTHGCGGSTPPPTTGRSSLSAATPSGWTGCAPIGATCCASPDR